MIQLLKLARHTDTGKEALIFLAFENRSLQSGGRHRSEQLEELITQAGWVLQDLPERRPNFRLLTLLWGIFAYCRLGFFRPFCIESLRGAGADYYQLTKTFRAYPKIAVLVLEGTGNTALLMVGAARLKRVRVIVVPANLEALAPYDRIFTHRIEIFSRWKQEVRLMRGIDAAFCISAEEEWLLRVFGLPAFYLPYRPPAALAAHLGRLREIRKPIEGFGFLVLGSVSNQPTLKGFRALYGMLTDAMAGLAITIHIAGHGTEDLKHEFTDPRIVLHGTVSNQTLDDLMTKVEGIVLMQAPSSGFLTRVIEACYVGIPVIGNADAVKGLRDLAGIHVFHRANNLREWLCTRLDSPDLPTDPVDEIELFQSVLLGEFPPTHSGLPAQPPFNLHYR